MLEHQNAPDALRGSGNKDTIFSFGGERTGLTFQGNPVNAVSFHRRPPVPGGGTAGTSGHKEACHEAGHRCQHCNCCISHIAVKSCG